jgi:hypothetical protein
MAAATVTYVTVDLVCKGVKVEGVFKTTLSNGKIFIHGKRSVVNGSAEFISKRGAVIKCSSDQGVAGVGVSCVPAKCSEDMLMILARNVIQAESMF